MLMIVAHHFAVHGGFDFSTESITLNRLWIQLIALGGRLGNDIFVMISGYFLVTSSSVKIRKVFYLWSEMFFYSVVIFWLFNLLGARSFSIKEAIKNFMPVTRNVWWFASTYFVLYLIHPYINVILQNLKHEDYKKFLMAILVYWSIIPTFLLSNFNGSSLVDFICLYSIAGYLRLWASNFGGKKYILYGISFAALNYLSAIGLDILGIKFPLAGKNAMYFYNMMRPFTILSALCLVIGFRKLRIEYCRLINLIASATFGVYLIHEHNFVRPFLWKSVFMNYSFQDNPYLIPYSIAVILVVYVTCTIIELLRIKIFSVCVRAMALR